MANLGCSAEIYPDGVYGDRGSVRAGRGGISVRLFAAAMAGVAALLIAPGDAAAGSATYDMAPMLDAAHPFASASPSAAPAARSPRTSPSSSRPAARNDDTLIGLLGIEPAAGPSTSRPPSSSAAPQLAAADLAPTINGDPPFFTIGGGWFDFNDNEQAAELRLEWRGRKALWIFKPFAGLMATSDFALYGYGGFLTDFFFGRRIVLTPSFAAGLYEDGDGKDLGSVIEFRSGLELGWRFDNRSRLSAMVYHISNAGIDDNNPGTEIFSMGYSIPLQ